MTEYLKLNKLSPFHLKDLLIEAANKKGEGTVLNAGRGNPNFFNKFCRIAFYHLSEIALEYINKLSNIEIGIVGYQTLDEFDENKFMLEVSNSDKIKSKNERIFLTNYLIYLYSESERLGLNPKEIIYNLVTSLIGCFYPIPPVIQPHVKITIENYMHKMIFGSSDTDEKPEDYDYFTTEGAAAGILYVFNTLHINKLLKEGDSIAIITPIFSPYLEMPKLKVYGLNIIELKCNPHKNYELDDKDIDILKKTEIKALFMVNPANPGAFSLPEHNLKKIGKIVKKYRNNLIIVSDSVYAPFTKKFNSFMKYCPKNTIEIFSLSKYYGTTGWRLGVTMIRKDNNINKLFNTLSSKTIENLGHRYEIVTNTPEELSLMDRIVMDSRQVAEEHVGGLSTPQQSLMALFLFYDHIDIENIYKNEIRKLLITRMNNLYKELEIKPIINDLSSEYYTLINILEITEKIHGKEAKQEISKNSNYLEFLFVLANEYQVVLLPGKGFGSDKWAVRVSLANLDTDKYLLISKAIRNTINDLVNKYHK